jgi:hypothetical protein
LTGNRISLKTIVLTLVVLFVIATVSVIGLWSTTTNPRINDEIRVEVVKSLLQFAVIVIFGGTVTAILKLVEREGKLRQRAAEQEASNIRIRAIILENYLRRLGTIYRQVKASRRALRAAGLTTKFNKAPEFLSHKQSQVYMQQMLALNDAQLELERLKIDAKSLPAFVPLPMLFTKLEIMEDYLRQILAEYEEHAPLLDIDSSNLKFADLVSLVEFTSGTKQDVHSGSYKFKNNYRLKSHFSNVYEAATYMIKSKLV